MTWAFGRQTPDNNLMRFVSKRFSSPTRFLDIGSGEGANARELRARGHTVITIDKDPSTMPDYVADITSWEPGWIRPFDHIYDVNTLCHVEDPPWGKIKSWLKPETGIFFSICPSSSTSEIVKEGKEFTRLSSPGDITDMLRPHFSEVQIGSTHYSLPGQPYFGSWIIEAK